MKVCVVGIGAMGGGIARALLKSNDIESVVGYDVSEQLMNAFYEEAKSVSKHVGESIPNNLKDALNDVDVCMLVLVNEEQCQQVCSSILDLDNTCHYSGRTIILSSTVRASWVRQTASVFEQRGIQFVDCPISGGPVRALAGELSIMASSNHDDVLEQCQPLFQAMASSNSIHIIPGGCGMGSTAKMVHQLLAGVHIAVTAEAIHLANKTGLNPNQLYDIVNTAAGQSWMFTDRGSRMLPLTTDNNNNNDPQQQVKSALNLFVKDLNIVQSESQSCASPIPIATAALQQFLIGKSLGLGPLDDSQVYKVYQQQQQQSTAQKDDTWLLPSGEEEQIVDVGDEARHEVVISNDYTRIMKISFPPGDTTTAHRHVADSLYFFLVPGGNNVINHIQGMEPCCDVMEFGEVRYGSHFTDNKPLVHKITNTNPSEDMCGLDAEILKRPPIVNPIPMVATYHTLIKTRPKCRVYHLVLPPGETVELNYPFFFVTVVVGGGSAIEKSIPTGNRHLTYTESYEKGHVEWNQPIFGIQLTNKNTETPFEQYIAEWC